VLAKLADRVGNHFRDAAQRIARFGVDAEHQSVLDRLAAGAQQTDVRRVFALGHTAELAQKVFTADIVIHRRGIDALVRILDAAHHIEIVKRVVVANQDIRRLDALHAGFGDLAVMDPAAHRGKAVDQRRHKVVLCRGGLGQIEFLFCGRTASGITSVSHAHMIHPPTEFVLFNENSASSHSIPNHNTKFLIYFSDLENRKDLQMKVLLINLVQILTFKKQTKKAA